MVFSLEVSCLITLGAALPVQKSPLRLLHVSVIYIVIFLPKLAPAVKASLESVHVICNSWLIVRILPFYLT